MTEMPIFQIYLHDKPVGTLTNLPGDRNLFSFSQSYMDDLDRPTLSLSFLDVANDLIIDSRPVRRRVPPFFSNLLPEGHLRDYLSAHAKVSSEREFPLLVALGEDLPGALRIGPMTDELHRPLVGHTTDELVDDGKGDGALHFSLAGVQLKFSAIWEDEGGLTIPLGGVGGSWIAKLPSSSFAGVPQNEYSMMELARRVGIHVPQTALVPLHSIKNLPKDVGNVEAHAFVIKRFDRDADGRRIHIEDFAQVFGLFPEKKYQSASYRNIAEVIWNAVGEEGIVEFIRRFVFNALIGNGDMHLKNWSLIYPDRKTPELAPAYDFVSTLAYIPGDNLALNFVDSKEFNSLTMDQFKRFAAKSRLPEKLVVDSVGETVDRFREVWKSTNDLPVDGRVLESIDRHLVRLPLWIDFV